MDPAPQDPAILRALAEQRRERGDELGALAHLIAAQCVEASIAGSAPGAVADLCKVATGYFMTGDDESAERWYRLVLKLEPDTAVAYQNLAAICARSGRMAESDSCREQAYGIARVFIESPSAPVRRLLILHAGRTSGNVPLDALLSSGGSLCIRYAIDYAAEAEDLQLPPFDLVFNAIGDPDIAAPLAARLECFVEICNKPLLNAPATVARTPRDRLPHVLHGLADVVVPACSRFQAPLSSADALRTLLLRAGIDWPILARPAATHGGAGLMRYDTLPALERALKGTAGLQYLTAFRNYQSTDGQYRKYRAIFIDRAPWPYHLAISSHWLVHYFSAAMTDSPAKIAEEHRFLEDPGAVLGARAWAAVAAIGRRLDLDYGGVDFAVLGDGRVLVFEANATMLVHRERHNGPLAHKNRYVQRVVDAFEALLSRRSTP